MEASWPKRVIIGTGDYWAMFVWETQGLPIHSNDRYEIIAMIFDVLMSYSDDGEYRLKQVPDLNRIVARDDYVADQAKHDRLHLAVQRLAQNIFARVQGELNGVRHTYDDGIVGFPYYVERFLGDDVVLDHMPH